MDLLFTRRLLQGASRRFVLTRQEGDDLRAILGPGAATERLMNGVPKASQRAHPSEKKEVLFCARLHTRKRPVSFVEVADELTRRGLGATFSLVGPDEGELAAVLKAIREHRLEQVVRYDGALNYGEVLDRMRRASVYLLPAVDEPFPMSLLEALSVGLPSVCTTSCGVADMLRKRKAAMVSDESVEGMANAVQQVLDDELLRDALMVNAEKAVAEVFSMEAVINQLEKAYVDVMNRSRRS
jgi:glycosyltransferase involved in cell wall biosynthesis